MRIVVSHSHLSLHLSLVGSKPWVCVSLGKDCMFMGSLGIQVEGTLQSITVFHALFSN